MTETQLPYNDPLQEVDYAGPQFVPALANVLTHLASLTGRPNKVTPFHCVRAPQLGVYDYLMRISKYFQCSNECFVMSLVYIDRIVKLHPEFTICSLNIHRLLVTSVMLAVKFYDDVYYSNAYYGKVGGVKTKEINTLEHQFLRLLDWNLHVSPQEYTQYRNHVYEVLNVPPADSSPQNSMQVVGTTAQQKSALIVDVKMTAVETEKIQDAEEMEA